MKEEIEKYATLIIAMSLDFQAGKINYDHYVNTLSMIADKMQELLMINAHQTDDL